MPQQDLGIKRICLACQTRFYDLRRKPAVCPKCEAVCDVGAFYKAKRSRVVVKEVVAVAETLDPLEEIEDETPEPEEGNPLIEDLEDLDEEDNVVEIVSKREEKEDR